MVFKNGAFRSSAATARFVLLLLLLLLLLLGVGKGNSVSADPWRLPCGTTAPSSADLARVMLSMQQGAAETEGAARLLQRFLTVSQTLIAYRIHLSKAFLFLKESAMYRQQYCRESRPDRGEAMSLTRAVLHRIQLTLCNLDTYLSCSGHPMPSHLIPNQTALLQTSRANRHVLCQYAFYNDRAYVVARETIDLVGRLSERLSALSSASD